jgi:dTDP-4-amino-4,6-dideoxy-D-galactose acyltransferase
MKTVLKYNKTIGRQKSTTPLLHRKAIAPGELLAWDTDFFGFRIGRARANRLTAKSAAVLLDWADTCGLRCLYLGADPACSLTLNVAYASGFKFVDFRLDLAISLERIQPSPKPRAFQAVVSADIPSLVRIARLAHTDSRFFKDAGFSRERAANLYAEWIRRDFRENHIFTIAAPNDNEPTNYITCQLDTTSRTGRIGLLAVSKRVQGRGIGRRLLVGALSWLSSRGCQHVQVATQGSNLAAQRLYQTAGFSIEEAVTTYHRWF